MQQAVAQGSMTSFDVLPERAREVLRRAIDVHVHASPDPYTERRMDARRLVQMASASGMAGLVLKSHEYPTQPLAWALQDETPGFRVYGALSLDNGNGGINAEAVEVSLRMGGTVVWMPTFDAADYRIHAAGREFRGEPVPVVDGKGALLPGVHAVLDCIQAHDAVLATGHLSGAETSTLVQESRRRGIRTILTHVSTSIPLEVQQEAVGLGAYVEHCAIAATRERPDEVVADIAHQIREVGVEHVILSTDLGQANNPDPPVGFGQWIERFLASGFSSDQVGRMVRQNPADLLGR